MKVKLKDVCTFYSGTGFPTQYQGKEEGQYPFYKVSDIANNATSGKIYLESCNNYINDDVLGKIKGCVVPRNTVVFAKIGEALKLNRRAITSCDCLIDNNAMGIAPQADFLRIQYFYLFMKNLKMQLLAESTTVPSVRKTKLENYELILPSLINQEEIENKIFAVLNIIEKRRQELKLLDNLIKARFVEMFGDPVFNPYGYDKVALSDLADIKIGPFGSLLHKEDYIEGGHPLLNPSHIVDGKISPDDKLTISDEKYEELSAYQLKTGDVVMGRRGEMGRCAVVYEDGLLCGTGSMFIRTKGEVTADYIQKIISFPSFKKTIEDMAVGQTMPNLNVPIVSGFQIIKPPMEVQDRYYAFVDQVDKSKLLSLIKLLEQLITYLYNVFIIYRQDKGEEVEDHE